MALFDFLTFGLYFLAVAAIAVTVSRGLKSGNDLFLAGRNLGFVSIGLALFASNISSTTLIGLMGEAYRNGISVANFEWIAGLILIFGAFFVFPAFLRSRITTIPEFLEGRFSPKIRGYYSMITIVISMFADTAGSLYAGALVLIMFIPELTLTPTCILLALLTGSYTVAGGLKAVVYTESLQAIILLLASAVLALLTFAQFDFSWGLIQDTLPDGHLSLIRPLDDPGIPWLGTLIGIPAIGVFYWVMNQYIVQRVLGAKTAWHASAGAVFAGALKLLPLFIMVLPGALALPLFPGLARADLVYPKLVETFLPPGLKGLVLAGLTAALMSSVASTLNSSATLLIHDFIVPKKPRLSPKALLNAGRLATAGFMLFAAFWAPFIQFFPGIFSYLQQVFSYLAPPLVAIFLTGLFFPGVSAKAAWITLIGGHAVSFLVMILQFAGWITLHYTIIAGSLTFACGMVCLLLSRFWPNTQDKRDFMFVSPTLRPSRTLSLFYDIRLHAGFILLLMGVLLVAFW